MNWTCSNCAKKFKTLRGLRIHRKLSKHKGLTGPEQPAVPAKGSGHRCKLCQRTFTTPQGLALHHTCKHRKSLPAGKTKLAAATSVTRSEMNYCLNCGLHITGLAQAIERGGGGYVLFNNCPRCGLNLSLVKTVLHTAAQITEA